MPVADTYGLTRNAKESSRLNEQHVVWKDNIGFLLHPSIAASIPSDAHIGDMGTGTGVWITDVARETEGSRYSYEGIDMSSSQFPAVPPRDMVFTTMNMLDPVPEHKKATFDVIHLRLLVLGLPPGKWVAACENLFQLLKPGGWLQWEEADFAAMKVLQLEPGANTSSSQLMIHTIIQEGLKRGQGFDDVQKLASIASDAGFDHVSTDVLSSDRVSTTRADFNKTIIGAFSGVMEMFKKMDGGEGFWGSNARLEMFESTILEIGSGKVYFRAELNVVTAQKA